MKRNGSILLRMLKWELRIKFKREYIVTEFKVKRVKFRFSDDLLWCYGFNKF